MDSYCGPCMKTIGLLFSNIKITLNQGPATEDQNEKIKVSIAWLWRMICKNFFIPLNKSVHEKFWQCAWMYQIRFEKFAIAENQIGFTINASQ